MLVSDYWSLIILFTISFASTRWLRKRIVRRYEYLIVYKGKKENRLTDGMIAIVGNGKIKDFRYLKAIQECIEIEEDLEKVIITNYKLLKRVWRLKNDSKSLHK